MLLDRKMFKESVFERDNGACIVCKHKAIDAHHIIDRKLFFNGGYYLNNGVSLCEEHHLEAEKTIISASRLRILANIGIILYPYHFYESLHYDKWGNVITTSSITRGEFYFDEPIRQLLSVSPRKFNQYTIYPKIYKAPWTTNDPNSSINIDKLVGMDVVAFLSHDSDNLSVYHTGDVHHRMLTNEKITNFLYKNLPPCGWRIVYEQFCDKMYINSIWNDAGECISWNDTIEWCELMEIQHLPIIFNDIFNATTLENLSHQYKNDLHIIIRPKDIFKYKDIRFLLMRA